MSTSPDPRVKSPGGPHPDIAAVKALAESVHARLDALGVPRAIEIENFGPGDQRHELTLLGRVDAWLKQAEEPA